MLPFNPLFNDAGRLRSGWRFAIFIVAYFTLWLFLLPGVSVAFFLPLGRDAALALLQSNWGFVVQALVTFSAALLIGWICGRALEGLPLRALGYAFHGGWLRDFMKGSLVGAASLAFAVAVASAGGGFSFAPAPSALLPAVLATLASAASIFILSAAAEEILFRGYPLQTVLRSLPVWAALVPSSVFFAWMHLSNPNVVPGVTFVNTSLAGVWLAVAYVRTRSLWFPLGLHWAWNWAMGALFGIPVSGITRLTPVPLLQLTGAEPAWLTGGAYGLEGGAACTVALLASTAFVWRTRLVAATPEMLRLTSKEVPPARQSAAQQSAADLNTRRARNDGPPLPETD